MAHQQKVDLGIKKKEFHIYCFHISDICVKLALSETLWTKDRCELQRGRKVWCIHSNTQIVCHTLISESVNLHYTCQIWLVNSSCKRCCWGIKRCFSAWKFWLLGCLNGESLDRVGMTALTWRIAGKETVHIYLKKRDTLGSSGWMFNAFHMSWLLDNYLCPCVACVYSMYNLV